MAGITLGYFLRRLGVFFLTIWIAATIIFIIPRLAPGDPVSAMVSRMTQTAGFVENAEAMIEGWKERLGLNEPLYIQYLKYLGSIFTWDFGFSLSGFPTTVQSMILRALPWTIGLLTVATALVFLIGNLLGALLAWKKSPKLLKYLIPVTMVFTSLPSILAALFLIYLFAVVLSWFPIQGSYGRGLIPGFNWEFIKSVVWHGILPALSIVVVSFGYWTLGMRGMMVTVEGEDYMMLAEAKGLNPFYSLYRYMIRNAILPQITALALSVGGLVGGSILVEYIFNFRGMGNVIFRAIRDQDYAVIQGTSFILIVATALAVFILDILYPLVDPRISHEGR